MKNLAPIFLGAVLIGLGSQAVAKPAKRHSAAQGTVETHVSPSEISGRVTAPPVATADAAKTPRAKRRVATAATATETTTPIFGGGDLVSEARKYLGGNPTGRGSLWCGAFMDMVLKHTGHRGGGNLARAYAGYGTRVSGPQVGAIAVMTRGGGGHVGVVSGIDASGNPIVISGNHNNTVAESVYPRSRIIAYVMPN
jgi:uncharacterized protein (TIGR02594 family)